MMRKTPIPKTKTTFQIKNQRSFFVMVQRAKKYSIIIQFKEPKLLSRTTEVSNPRRSIATASIALGMKLKATITRRSFAKNSVVPEIGRVAKKAVSEAGGSACTTRAMVRRVSGI